jgi:hypothetical protein
LLSFKSTKLSYPLDLGSEFSAPASSKTAVSKGRSQEPEQSVDHGLIALRFLTEKGIFGYPYLLFSSMAIEMGNLQSNA